MDMNITHLLDSLGWALLHSLWQGSLALIVVVIIRAFLKNNAPSFRYAAQLFVLVACFAAFLTTFGIYFKTGLHTGGEGLGLHVVGAVPLADLTSPISQTFSNGLSAMQTSLSVDATRWAPVIGVFWCLGFAFMALRYAGAFMLTQRLRRHGLSNPSTAWTNRFRTLVLNAGLPADIKLHISQYVSGPVTMGFIKPVVLVPVGFLTGLPREQVEAILLHEIAHIRRYDYALNLVQTAIKTVFFFHPAIHYISRRIDIDREQACDDLAVAQSRNPQALAKGLATLRLQSCAHGLTMNAVGNGTDTPLLDRLARLAGYSESPRRSEHMIISAVAALLIGSAYVATANAHPDNAEPNKQHPHALERLEDKIEHQIEEAYERRMAAQELAEDARERAYESAQEAREQALERAQDAREQAQEDRERAFEMEHEREAHEQHTNLHFKLYDQLLNDEMMSSEGGSVTMKFVNDSWTVNGTAVPTKSENKYCRILADMGVRKSAQTKVKVSPKSTHIVSQSHDGKFRQTYNITHGEFSHNHYGHGQHTPAAPQPPVLSTPHVAPYVSPIAPKPPVAPIPTAAPIAPTAPFIVPTVSQKVNVKFGMKDTAWTQKHNHGHKGIDLGANTGSPVYASREGEVTFVAKEPAWGNRVIIKHADGYQTLYAHLNNFVVTQGERVTAGQVIGTVGSTGNSPGPHLHFEIRKDGTPIDPSPFIF